MGIPLYKPRETDDATNREKKEHASSLQQLLSRQQALRNALVSHQQARRNGLEAGNATNGNNGRIQPPASPNVATTHRRSRAFVAAIRRANSSLLRRPTQQQSTENEQGNRDRNMTITRRPSNAESLTDDGIDQMVQQRFNEKEDLLNQLQFTASLLGQFLSARSVLGSDTMEIPSFITEDLPAVLASAASLSSSHTSSSSGSSSTSGSDREEIVDRLLRVPPYSTRLQVLESSIAMAQRRIRELLSLLGTSVEDGNSSTAGTPTRARRSVPLTRTASRVSLRRSVLQSPSPPLQSAIPLPSQDDDNDGPTTALRMPLNRPASPS